MSGLDIKSFRSLTPKEKRKVCRLLGLLARPELSEEQKKSLRGYHDRQPFLPSLALLLPLFQHHCERADQSLENLFCAPIPSPPSKEQLMRTYRQARVALYDALQLFEMAGIGRILTIKGTALAPYYSAPALRQKCDDDLVVSEDDLDAARAALSYGGWDRVSVGGGHVWRHPNGALLDLHAPNSDFYTRVLATAVPHELMEGFLRPTHGTHLALLAIHSAHHVGDRFWRDVVDARLLFSLEGLGHLIEEAMAACGNDDERAAVRGFLAALRKLAGDEFIPRQQLSPAARRFLQLYERMATETLSMSTLLLVPIRPAALFRIFRKRKPKKRVAAAGISDPQLGALPSSGTVGGAMLKLRVLFALLRSGRLRSARELLRLQRWASQAMNQSSGGQ